MQLHCLNYLKIRLQIGEVGLQKRRPKASLKYLNKNGVLLKLGELTYRIF